jgi:hypothetical protein
MIDKKKVKELLISGKKLREVANIVGCTPQNVYLLSKKLGLSRTDYGKGLERKLEKEQITVEFKRRWGRDSWFLDDLGEARSQCFLRKRENARRTKWGWDVMPGDLSWPTHCPILGLELDYFADKRQENSPSFDRIDPTKGYTKGNVEILSWRANRIKNDGTREEHELIAKHMAQMN